MTTKWTCSSCSTENNGSFCTNCGQARPVKVYVGRKSLNMGDDANCPNMFTFYLKDDPEAVIDAMYGHGLPAYTFWDCYLGEPCPSSSDEDGIQVPRKSSAEILFKILESPDPHKPVYEFAEGWYEKIKAHPYIYCQ